MIERLRRVVIDTNIVLSGFIKPESVPAQAMETAVREGEVLISAAVFREFEAVLDRPKFDRYGPLASRQRYLQAFLNGVKMIRIVHTVTDCRHPKDNKFLELALSGQADAIVTGDLDLLALHPWRGIAVLTPADYLAQPG